MTPDTIDRLDARFAEFPMLRAADPPSEAEIMQAEQQIGVLFPDDYRQFLLRYGGAMVGAYPVFGLRPVDVMGVSHWSVLDVTRHYRSDGVPGTDQWTVISEDHAGNPIGMDQDGVIWIHDHDFGGISPIARSFEDYIRTRCMKVSSGD
jgi:cell wall assembly regulator SMI1